MLIIGLENEFKSKFGGKYMKATGIVRRIDDLGRVVIPKEIRRTLRIREGDPSKILRTPFENIYLTFQKLQERLAFPFLSNQ